MVPECQRGKTPDPPCDRTHHAGGCDHDLGDYACDGGDGIKLLDWLAETRQFLPVRIHTMNPVGRENMERLLRRYWP